MPVPTRVQHDKNIWVAAGDGDLQRVRELIERQALSPNTPDENTYTPMHAAASYGQLHVLDYLVSKGGDVNVTDSDDDTPLYVVENVETARWLVEHGATVHRQNSEGLSPAQYLQEDSPEVSAYLNDLAAQTTAIATEDTTPPYQPSQHAQNLASEHLTASLIESVQHVMERTEAEGRDPDEELQQVVSKTVLEGMVTAYGMSTLGGERREDAQDRVDGDVSENGVKRPRMDGPA